MKLYKSGEAVKVQLPFVDDNGQRLVPTSLTYQVLDDLGEVITATTSIGTFDATAGAVTITVPAAPNTLLTTESHGFRRVSLAISTGSYVYHQNFDYLLEAESEFIIPSNSFMTYETALVTARSVTPLNGWNVATEENRKFALLRAFDQMRSFTYELRLNDNTTDYKTLDEMELMQFQTLLTTQLKDFRKAQLVQADYLLGGSPIEKGIEDGLQSSTIGEISQFYRPRPTLNLAICKGALSYVGKYIRWTLKLGRA